MQGLALMPGCAKSRVLLGGLVLLTISTSCKSQLVDLQLPLSAREDDDDGEPKPNDRDDDADEEMRIPCDDDSECSGEEHMCHPTGVCTECVGDDDCPPGQTCDGDDNECEVIKPRP